MFNPCIEHCYVRNGKEYSSECDNICTYAQIAKEKRELEEELNQPIRTLDELTGYLCCIMECKNCPVCIHDYEKRTKEEKENSHEPCVTNLCKWIVEQAMK